MSENISERCDLDTHLDRTRLAAGVRRLRFGAPEPTPRGLRNMGLGDSAADGGARLVEGTKLVEGSSHLDISAGQSASREGSGAGASASERPAEAEPERAGAGARTVRVNVTAFPDAGEAVLTLCLPRPDREQVAKGEGGDPEASRLRACRRAKAQTRRYAKANKLTRLGTLTFAEPESDPDRVVKAVQGFWKRLRKAWGGEAFPYLWVIEPHESGSLHVHFCVHRLVPTVCGRCDGPERPKGLVRARPGEPCLTCVWGLGFVDMRKVRGRKGHPLGGRQAARQCAGYIAKYLGKAYGSEGADAGLGRHRYEVAQGFQPEMVRVTVPTGFYPALEAVCEVYGGGRAPGYVWRSSDMEDWQGPPVWLVFLD